jgi:hypothetical protein
MKRHLVLTLFLMPLVAGLALRISIPQDLPATEKSAPSSDTNAAYRDGLYQGKQSAERAPNQAPIGRWSTKIDRSAFTTGYGEAYRAPILNELSKESFH